MIGNIQKNRHLMKTAVIRHLLAKRVNLVFANPSSKFIGKRLARLIQVIGSGIAMNQSVRK